jgi:TP901 family phage tail tape measure protein
VANRTITVKILMDDADVARFEGNLRRSLGGGSSALEQFGDQAKKVGLALTAAITTPLILMGREVLRVGNEYQQSMNMFQAATKASATEMAAAGAKAKQLGADMALPATSAGDAARAMTELAKGGLSATQAMDAARGTLLLAAAAAIDEAEAATIAANALNTFHLEAKEAGRVADLLAAAANASSAEITDVALAMQQSGAAAAALHVPIEDLTTAIGLMANNGIKGSDAGTSLKTALISLVPKSKEAREEMERLGINAFDAQGKMLPMREVVAQVSESFGKLTDEQKLSAAQTIFGSDAMRAALIVFGGGVETFDKLKQQVTAQGAAAELAGAKTKGLAGAWEGLKSQLETGALIIFERLAPPLEKIIKQLADFATRAINTLEALSVTNPQLVNMGLAFTAVAAAVGPVMLGLAGLATAIGTISGPFLVAAAAITAGAAALAAAWSTNFLGIRDVTNRVMTEVRRFANENLDTIVKWWRDNLPLIKQTVETVLSAIKTFWNNYGRDIFAIVKDNWDIIKSTIKLALDVILGSVKLAMQVITGDWRGAFNTLLDIAKSITTGIVNATKALASGMVDQFKLAVSLSIGAMRAAVGLFFDIGNDIVGGLVNGIKNSAGNVIAAAKNLAGLLPEWVKRVLDIQSPSRVFHKIGTDTGQGLVDGILAKASDVAKASQALAKSAIDDARQAAAEAIALANASLATLQFLKQADDAREWEAVLQDIRRLRREMGADEAAQLPKSLAHARAIQAGYEAQKQAIVDLKQNQANLKRDEQSLDADRANWAQQQTERWLEQKQQTEEVLVLVNREKEARLAALKEIDEADRNARDSIVASRVYIADQTVFHSDRATASILGHLARQKGVTESVADAFIGLYDGVFGKLNSLIDGWTSKLGIFGEFVGTIFKGIVNNIANNILGSLFGQNGLLSGIVNRIGGTLGNVLGGILGTGGGGAGGAAGGIGNIVGGILGIGGGATGGATSGVLGGILGALGIGGTASIAGGTTALAGGAVGLSTIGAGAAGLSGISTGTSLGVAAGAGGSGVAGILGSIGAFATSGLGIATFGIGTAAALIGTYLIKRAKQRRNDEEASGVALQDAVDLIKNTALDIDNDKLRFSSEGDSQALLDQGVLKPFKDFINTLKTSSVRDSRLTNQVRDLENLYNDLVGSAIKRQQERIAAAAVNPTTSTGTTSGTGTSDPFNFASAPTTVTIETLTVSFLAGTEDLSKAFVSGGQTKDGQAVIVKTVKIAAANGEL